MIKIHRARTIIYLSCLALATFAIPATAETDYDWPYQQISMTSFARVIGPNAADANFVINGRPKAFNKIDPELANLETEIRNLLKEAEQAQESSSRAFILLTEPNIYLKKAKQALANIGNPALKLIEGEDFLQIQFSPPGWSLGKSEITLYDALAAIQARTRDFADAYKSMTKSYELKKRFYGPESDEAAQQLIDIASLNEDVHNHNAAEKYFKQAYDIICKTHGEHSKEAGAVLMQLCMVTHSGCPSAGEKALSTMERLAIKTSGFSLPRSGPHFWSAEKSRINAVLSAARQAVARQKAEASAMKELVYNMIHSEELRKKQEEIAAELAAKAALKRWIQETNEELLGKCPSIVGVHFYNRVESIAGELWFHPGGEVEIVPQYRKLDGETQPPAILGEYKMSDAAEGDAEEIPIVVVTSKADKRIDKWHIRVSDEALGEIFLNAYERKDPYPALLKGKSKVKIPDDIAAELKNAQNPEPQRSKEKTGSLPPSLPPPPPGGMR